MDVLGKFIVERLKCRFHPYLSPNARLRHYPGYMATLLKVLNPLHIVSVTSDIVAVDGVFVEDDRPIKEKYSVAEEAVSSLFGEVEEKVCLAGNCEARYHESPVVSISLYMGPIWYLIPSTPVEIPHFAYKTDESSDLYQHDRDGVYVRCYGLIGGEPKVKVPVSREFFVDPRAENVTAFGDLCFLTQMREGWSVSSIVDIQTYNSHFSLYWGEAVEQAAEILKVCVGVKSLIQHGYAELLLRTVGDPQVEGWKRLIRLLEGEE
ncbi:hypothetical protein B6U84_00035 [Candidatus Bathyarchaeota archaeon ex4484_40]|nr:MAG: hypothetical protein B6U84_00035 [Candidatus Bathyarchaeota archaeon ex4484_40]